MVGRLTGEELGKQTLESFYQHLHVVVVVVVVDDDLGWQAPMLWESIQGADNQTFVGLALRD